MDALALAGHEAIRAGAALFTGVPGDEVDLDRLEAHLAARNFDGGVVVGDQAADCVLWFADGAPREVWVFEGDPAPALLPVGPGRDRLRMIAGRGGLVSVVVCTPPAPPIEPEASAAGLDLETGSEPDYDPATAVRPSSAVTMEPPPRPWPAILERVAARVARHRGPRLAAQFSAALHRALAVHGGAVDGERVLAPDLPESTWRLIVESACAPVVAVAGRAFTDRTIAAAERALTASDEEPAP